MPAPWTLATLISQARTVLEAPDPGPALAPSVEAFTPEQVEIPDDHSYWIEPKGLVHATPMGNYQAARIDAIEIQVALRADFAEDLPEPMIALLLAIGRLLIVDGELAAYHAEIGGLTVRHAAGQEYTVGTLAVTLDYDYLEAIVP